MPSWACHISGVDWSKMTLMAFGVSSKSAK
jgi:hypothetical protein